MILNLYIQRRIRLLITVLIGVVGVQSMFALLDVDAGRSDLMGLSIEELLGLRVTTASILDTPWIRQPASISIVDDTSVEHSPYRYLEDILETIPGTSMGIDVFGVTSLNFRGHWAHEGKVLLLLDGFPVNDMLYGDLNLQRHYPVSQIQSVEVLRGAGTAKYGGNAQLAVIKVTTLPSDKRQQFEVSGNWIKGAGWGQQSTISSGLHHLAEDLDVSFTAFYSRSPYSGETWTDTSGSEIELKDLAEIKAWNSLLRLNWKSLEIQLLHDSHNSRTPHGFGFARLGEDVTFQNTSVSAVYDIRLSDQWSLQPSFLYRCQEDWHIDRNPGLQPKVKDFFLNASNVRASVEATYDGDFLDLQSGIEWWTEHGFAESPGGVTSDVESYFAGERSVDYSGFSAYTQADLQSEHWMSSAGIRYSHHSYSDSSLVPRVSLGYFSNSWHLKLNAGQAFREPDIEVINSSDWNQPAIEPELTSSVDLEYGQKLGKTAFITGTLFYIQIQDPIIYTSSGQGSYFYFNNSTAKTWGFETEFRFRTQRSSFQGSYSFYHTANTPIEIYRIPNRSGVHAGIPAQKWVLSYHRQLPWDGWRFESSAIAYIGTYGWSYDREAVDFQGYNLSAQKLDDRLFLNLGFTYERADWSLRMQVFDALNTVRQYVQPYHSESTPYPGSGREIVLSFVWKW